MESSEKPLPGRVWLTRVIFGIVALAVIVCGAVYWYKRPPATPEMTTPYQAVLLSSGSAYFGRLEGLGTPFPVLRDVFYVQSAQDPQTKQVANTPIKRGKEWHAPDRMIINANMIVLVEPVSPGSRVAQLMAQAKNQ